MFNVWGLVCPCMATDIPTGDRILIITKRAELSLFPGRACMSVTPTPLPSPSTPRHKEVHRLFLIVKFAEWVAGSGLGGLWNGRSQPPRLKARHIAIWDMQ